VLEAVGGNKTLAAQVLGFDRRTLYRKLERVRDPSAREARESKVPSSDRHAAVGAGGGGAAPDDPHKTTP
jgi:hypothetical protein